MNLAAIDDTTVLRDRCEMLEEENRQLRAVVFGDKPPKPIVRVLLPDIPLSENEEKILYCLSRKDFTTYPALWHFLYGHLPPEKQPKSSILKVYLTAIREKIKPLGIEIKTIRGRGCEVCPEHRAIIAAHATRYDGGADVK